MTFDELSKEEQEAAIQTQLGRIPEPARSSAYYRSIARDSAKRADYPNKEETR